MSFRTVLQLMWKGVSVSNNSVTFYVWTSSNSGFLSVDLDANGLIQPDAQANCYSFA